MVKNLILIIFILFNFNLAKAEVVKEIVINGNLRISDETIKVYGEIEINKDFTEKDINKVLTNLYSTNFFETVDVNLKNNVLIVNLEEYPVINQLVITGEKKKANREQIKKIIQLKEKSSFIKSYLANDIELIKRLYSSLGYNFSEVEGKVRQIDKSNLDLLISINRGEQTKISSIKFIGNKKVRTKRLKDIIASEESKFWKVLSKNTILSENLINLDKRLLTNYYKSIGFYDVKLSSSFAEIKNNQGADLIYSIDEGTRYTINKISTNIDNNFDKKIFYPLNDEFKKIIGEYYSPFKIKNLLEDIDNLIDENNLQFVEHNVEEIIENDSINIVFNIFEGEKQLIEKINIVGNYATIEEVIRGELILDEGDPLTKINLDKSIAKIKARNLFKNVKYRVLDGSKDNLKVIDISLEEQPTGEIGAGAGVGTSGGTIAFNVKENNWLGQGKALELDVTLDEESLAGNLIYSDPNYDFLGNSLYYKLSSESNDKPKQGYENSIISAATGTSFEQFRNVDVSLGLSASYDDLKTESSASASLKKQSGTFSEIAANYGFTNDKRNRAFMPTSGSIISFSQAIPIVADRSFISNTFSASKYHSFSENLIGSGKLFLSSVNGLGDDDVRLSKRKILTKRRLRGFEKGKVGPVDGDDHVGGNYSAAINFEGSFPNFLPEDTNTDVNLFLDFGNVWGVDYDSSIDDSNKIRSATGLSVNWISPIGPMNFIFAQDLTKADTDKTESFSFNLGTTF